MGSGKITTRGTVARPPSEQLAAILRARGLSSYQLEKLSGVDHGTIRRFLSGERDLRLASVDKLAAALGLDLVERSRPKVRPAARGLAVAGPEGEIMAESPDGRRAPYVGGIMVGECDPLDVEGT